MNAHTTKMLSLGIILVAFATLEVKGFTLKLLCDDYSTIYYDGVEQKNVKGTGYWNSLATSTIPTSTKDIMVKCRNTGGPGGIKAEILDGEGKVVSVTGKSWQCSTRAIGGYKSATVTNEHGDWKNRAGSGAVIWSSAPSNGVVTAYCKFSLPQSTDYTMKMLCDDYSTIYYDGVEQKNVEGTNNWNALATTTIPGSTKNVMIKCKNGGGANGIKAQIMGPDGKIVTQTGKSWQCSTYATGGFKPATVENQHSDWGNRAGSGAVIWTGSTRDSTAYCKFKLEEDLCAVPASPAGYTMKMLCDDWSTIYYDGVEQKNVKGTGNWNALATTSIPASTSEVLVKCKNGGGPNGIKAEILNSAGKTVSVTGKSWQCSTSASGGFRPATVENVHSNWKSRAGSGAVIWTSSPKDATAYCKFALPHVSVPCKAPPSDYTMKMLCDDVSTIYYDGVEQKNVKGTNYWNSLATTTIPGSTKELMIKCKNSGGGPNGIKAIILDHDGKVVSQTGRSWECSTSASRGFKPATVENMHGDWKHRAGSGGVIWTSTTRDITVYCKVALPGAESEEAYTTYYYTYEEVPYEEK